MCFYWNSQPHGVRIYFVLFFYILPTVYLSVILVINQLNAQNLVL